MRTLYTLSVLLFLASSLLSAVVAAGCGSGSGSPAPGGDSGGSDASGKVDGGADSGKEGSTPGDGSASEDACVPMGFGDASPRGVYVPTFHNPIADGSVLYQETKESFVDGFFVSRGWDQIETSPGVYDFTSFDDDLRTVAAAGKKASLGIGGGAKSPSWICEGGADAGKAQCLSIVSSTKQGAKTGCVETLLPLPWDPVYQAQFGNMVKALGAHVEGDSTLKSTVILVKVTGFNYSDEETILPFQAGGTVACTIGNACKSGSCATTAALAALKAAGYTDDAAVSAFLTFARDFRDAFPGVPIGSQVSASLPSPSSDSLPFAMVQAFVADNCVRPITVQDQGLRALMGVDPGTLYALDAGVPVGYQMYAAVFGASPCTMGVGLPAPVTCDQSVLVDAINNGIGDGGARWLEIYETDVANYPDAAAYAHAKLSAP
jgi:hypothetical protein